MYRNLISLVFVFMGIASLSGIEIINKAGVITHVPYSELKAHAMESFRTIRHKDGKETIDNWKGIPLQKWLHDKQFDDFQSIRFESEDKYMVRIHSAEMDTMPGWIALYQNDVLVDSTAIRIIFPQQRDMFWLRGVARIILEDYRPVPKPRQMFISENAFKKLPLLNNSKPFADIKGYEFDTIMRDIFCDDEESVILVSRDGLRLRLEYPKHLKGAVIESTAEGKFNIKSPNIPGGMWLKDITYIQSGPIALIRKDYLPELASLYKLLEWKTAGNLQIGIKINAVIKELTLYNIENLADYNFQSDEWLELGD